MDAEQQDGAARAVCAAYAGTLAKLASGRLVARWYSMTRWNSLEPKDLALGSTDDHDLLGRAAHLIKRGEKAGQRRTGSRRSSQ